MTETEHDPPGTPEAPAPTPEHAADSFDSPDGRTYSGPVSAATPGQAAYEVMWAAAGVDVRWEDLDASDRQLWDVIAQAALDARVAEWTHDPLMDIPPGELVHLLGVVDLDSGGEAAYDGYRSASAARSLVSGQPLPQWAGQSEQIRAAWQAAAEGVVALLADKLTEAIAALDARPAPGDADQLAKVRAIVFRSDTQQSRMRDLVALLDPALDDPEPQPAPEPADAVAALTKVAESHERVMFAAAIDIRRSDPGAARILLGEQLGGWDGMPPWNGTESGAQYLERTGGGRPS